GEERGARPGTSRRREIPDPHRHQAGQPPIAARAKHRECSVEIDGWCPGEDSNLHELLHWYLKPARLPVPPPGQDGSASREAQKCTHWVGACQSGDPLGTRRRPRGSIPHAKLDGGVSERAI